MYQISAGNKEPVDDTKHYYVPITPEEERVISKFYPNIQDLFRQFIINKTKSCLKKIERGG